MRRSNIFQAVRSLEELVLDLRQMRDLATQADAPVGQWTETEEDALAAAEQALGPIRTAAAKNPRRTHTQSG